MDRAMERLYQVELDEPLFMQSIGTLLVEGDHAANRITVQMMDNGTAADLTNCTGAGYFRRADGDMVILKPEVSGNQLSVLLPQVCYAMPGQFQFLLRLEDSATGMIRTVLLLNGRVQMQGDGSLIDPGERIPSLEELLTQIETIEKAVTDANTASVSATEAAEHANSVADEVQAKLDAGAFNGKDGATGKGLTILGYYDTEAQLLAAVPTANAGDAYCVGTAIPYDIYVWDAIEGAWINNGSIATAGQEEILTLTATEYAALTATDKLQYYAQGIRLIAVSDTEEGSLPAVECGYYVPSVNTNGLLTWEPTDASMPAVASVNIRGPQGIQGEQGPQGEKGDKGDTGATGSQGEKGEKGDTGSTGQRGTGLLKITTAPSSYTTATGGFTPVYRVALSTVTTQAKVSEVLVGDVVGYNYYQYPVGYVDTSYVYLGTRVSIRGATGAAGSTPVKGTDYFTAAEQADMVAQVKALLVSELWTFTLENGSTVNKEVYIDG